MSKGTVMSIDQKWAYIFTEDCQMIKLPLQPQMAVGKEVRIQMENAKVKTVGNMHRFKPALIAASLVLVLALSLLFSQGLIFNPVYARVSIDVNPSLELSLNRQLEVIAVKAMNQEAEQLLIGENYKGLGLEEAVYRWTNKLQASNMYQVKTMLLSAVMPDLADALKTRLMKLEETQNQGELKDIAVRFIYSNDQAVVTQARKNGLSLGRQMLLNQAQVQKQNYNSENIADAPLGELVQKLLQNQDRNQNRVTEKTTQSLSEPSASGSMATSRETSRNSIGSSSSSGTGPSATTTNQNMNQYTNGNTQGSGTGTMSQQASQQTSGSTMGSGGGTTSQQMSQKTSQQTSGSTQGSEGGTISQQTSQQTSGSTMGSGTGSTGGSGNG